MNVCSVCGFEKRPGETHNQVQVIPSTREADDDVLITCIVTRDHYHSRVIEQNKRGHLPNSQRNMNDIG